MPKQTTKSVIKMMTKNKIIALSALVLAVLTACGPRESAVRAGTPAEVHNDSTVKTIIVDVRTPEEYAGDGHADCSVNYPLDQFAQHVDELKAYDKVVLVCRSGSRAGRALGILEDAGYTKAENAGPWQNAPCAH